VKMTRIHDKLLEQLASEAFLQADRSLFAPILSDGRLLPFQPYDL
jgi:hypothetical protein